MKSKGKQHDAWIKTRRAFLAANPPNHQGYYICYLCLRWIPAESITVDHVIPRSRAPHLRYAFSNLAVCCGPCNAAKGSKIVKPQKEEIAESDELEELWDTSLDF